MQKRILLTLSLNQQLLQRCQRHGHKNDAQNLVRRVFTCKHPFLKVQIQRSRIKNKHPRKQHRVPARQNPKQNSQSRSKSHSIRDVRKRLGFSQKEKQQNRREQQKK